MTDKATPTEVAHVLFLGMFRTDKGKRGYEWYFLPDGYQNDGSPIELDEKHTARYSGKPFVHGPSPGVICSIKRSTAPEDADSHTVFSTTAHIVDYWKCQKQVAEWKAKHAAVGLAFDAEKLSKGREDLELLEPFRALYGRHQLHQEASEKVRADHRLNGQKEHE